MLQDCHITVAGVRLILKNKRPPMPNLIIRGRVFITDDARISYECCV